MHADILGALKAINTSYRVFEHDKKPMTKAQVRAVLEYGLKKGYKTTKEFTKEEINQVLSEL